MYLVPLLLLSTDLGHLNLPFLSLSLITLSLGTSLYRALSPTPSFAPHSEEVPSHVP
jgi:hypothetical protein